jgi:hypothetical protein
VGTDTAASLISLGPAFVISRPLVPREQWKRSRARFRQRLAAALRSGSVPKIVSAPALHFPRPPTADRSGFLIHPHLHLKQSPITKTIRYESIEGYAYGKNARKSLAAFEKSDLVTIREYRHREKCSAGFYDIYCWMLRRQAERILI